jgi:diguanylate cyclase (GGDEF)-like protein
MIQISNLSLIVKTDLLLYSVFINIILFVYLNREESRNSYSSRLFKLIIISIAFVSLAEAATLFSGELGNASQIPLHYWSNVLFLSFLYIPGSFGFLYLEYKIFGSITRNKYFIYMVPTFLNISWVLINHFNRGIYFYIADTNQYYRGPVLYIITYFSHAFTISVVIYFFSHKRLITGRITQALLIFVLTPVLGALIQLVALGTTLVMPAYTLAAFMTFLLLEKDEMSRDPLTRLYTRVNMENRLRFKLKSNEPFSVILADLNDFKLINDNFGHIEGDKVLQKVSEILNQSVDYEDMVCRFGGDEFLIIIENRDNIAESVIKRIEQHLERYSRSINKYKIHLSFGAEYINEPISIGIKELIDRIDQKMYNDKMRRKKLAN